MSSNLKAFFIAAALAGVSAAVSGCSTTQQATAQADLQTAQVILKTAGCDVAALSAVAAPIVQVATDANGQKIAQLVDATGAAVCSAPAPALASPAGTVLGSPAS